MFDIIVKLMDLGLKGFTSSESYKKDNKYKELYLLYLAINEVIDKSVSANDHYFPIDLDSDFLVNTTSFEGPVEKWVYFTNEDFAELSVAVKKFLKQFKSCKAAISIHDPVLDKQLDLCFHGKAIWMRKFNQVFSAGTISSDGFKLVTKSLSIADAIDTDISINKFDSKVVVNEFDISQVEKRVALAKKGRENIEQMKVVAEQLRSFISNNVSVEQLL